MFQRHVLRDFCYVYSRAAVPISTSDAIFMFYIYLMADTNWCTVESDGVVFEHHVIIGVISVDLPTDFVHSLLVL